MAVTRYPYNSTVKLSAHFNIKEFRCKCAKKHETKFDPDFVVKLEKLYTALDCSRIVVNSGYRCYSHDRAVGGSGKGRHTVGDAADIKCYDQNNKLISTKIISCVAVELGFKGVANINKTHTAIHLDNRTTKYYGDEIYGYSSIWNQIGPGGKKYNDFYEYYGISKEDIEPYLKRVNVTTLPKKISITAQYGDNPDLTKWVAKKRSYVTEIQTILNDLGAKLTVDGMAGPKTYNALIKYPVKNGTKNTVVTWVQKRLTTMGYNPGTADGIAGANTMAAIEQFKKDYGLTTANLSGTAYYYLLV